MYWVENKVFIKFNLFLYGRTSLYIEVVEAAFIVNVWYADLDYLNYFQKSWFGTINKLLNYTLEIKKAATLQTALVISSFTVSIFDLAYFLEWFVLYYVHSKRYCV